MPPTPNTFEIKRLQRRAVIARPPLMAIGMPLAELQFVVQTAQDRNAPHFVTSQEPLQDGRAHRATNNRHYYRPQLRVARRPVAPLGPDVRFLKDSQGDVRLQFELEEVPPTGMPDGAEPFNVKVKEVSLHWRDAGGAAKTRVFGQPTFVSQDDPADGAKSNFRIVVGSDIAADEVELLFNALGSETSRAELKVTLTYGYWVDRSTSPNVDLLPVTRFRMVPAAPVNRPAPVAMRALRMRELRAATPTPDATGTPVRRATGTAGHRRRPPSAFEDAALAIARHNADRAALIREAEERKRNVNFKTATITRKIPFRFDARLDQNAPIYAAIMAGQTLGEGWVRSGFGFIRISDFPNTVYRLPEELRLAFNSELGTPHMLPYVYRDEEENPRVRVTLGALPWHDAAKLVELRDFLRQHSHGALAAPTIVVGGYEKATLRLTSAFPEHIDLLTSEELSIDLEDGFQFNLDLTLEFYRFLTQLLTSPVGITGEVTVTLEVEPSDDSDQLQSIESRVPVRLTLIRLAELPVRVEVDEDAVRPDQIRLVNLCRTEIRLADCVPRLLQYDTNSAMPLEVLDATVSEPSFPLTMHADQSLAVKIQPEERDPQSVWNAVQVELLGKEITQAATDVLERIHEVTPAGTLAWKLSIECPLLQRSPLPDNLQNLFKVEVKILRAGFDPQQVVLAVDTPKAELILERTLKDIVGVDALGLAAFTYQVRNIYYDRAGEWGEERPVAGLTVFVFPNSPENN